MFRLPNGIPNIHTTAQEWADYAEYQALKKGNITLRELVKAPQLVDDEIQVNGIEDDTDEFIRIADDIANEIRRRNLVTRNQYPFELGNLDYSLRYNESDELFHWVYKYLLLSTRLNMKDDRKQDGIDGTEILEKLSVEIASEFFGEKSVVKIFGTAMKHDGGFRGKLAEISSDMGEGGQIKENKFYRPKDDNIDVIVWKGFTDKKPSQLIAFGQCKTGTSWQDSLTELNVESFCGRWFTNALILKPIKLFFCSQYFPIDIWQERAYDAGLVFDRFRIIDYLPNRISNELLSEIKVWCIAAKNLYN